MSTDGSRRPIQFWQTFNTWWRSELDRLGRRPLANEINAWHERHAAHAWPAPEQRPTAQETRVHAKCLRSVAAVRVYFRKYRANKRRDPSEEDGREGDQAHAISKPPGSSAKGGGAYERASVKRTKTSVQNDPGMQRGVEEPEPGSRTPAASWPGGQPRAAQPMLTGVPAYEAGPSDTLARLQARLSDPGPLPHMFLGAAGLTAGDARSFTASVHSVRDTADPLPQCLSKDVPTKAARLSPALPSAKLEPHISAASGGSHGMAAAPTLTPPSQAAQTSHVALPVSRRVTPPPALSLAAVPRGGAAASSPVLMPCLSLKGGGSTQGGVDPLLSDAELKGVLRELGAEGLTPSGAHSGADWTRAVPSPALLPHPVHEGRTPVLMHVALQPSAGLPARQPAPNPFASAARLPSGGPPAAPVHHRTPPHASSQCAPGGLHTHATHPMQAPGSERGAPGHAPGSPIVSLVPTSSARSDHSSHGVYRPPSAGMHVPAPPPYLPVPPGCPDPHFRGWSGSAGQPWEHVRPVQVPAGPASAHRPAPQGSFWDDARAAPSMPSVPRQPPGQGVYPPLDTRGAAGHPCGRSVVTSGAGMSVPPQLSAPGWGPIMSASTAHSLSHVLPPRTTSTSSAQPAPSAPRLAIPGARCGAISPPVLWLGGTPGAHPPGGSALTCDSPLSLLLRVELEACGAYMDTGVRGGGLGACGGMSGFSLPHVPGPWHPAPYNAYPGAGGMVGSSSTGGSHRAPHAPVHVDAAPAHLQALPAGVDLRGPLAGGGSSPLAVEGGTAPPVDWWPHESALPSDPFLPSDQP